MPAIGSSSAVGYDNSCTRPRECQDYCDGLKKVMAVSAGVNIQQG
jgi:hypothetical protein